MTSRTRERQEIVNFLYYHFLMKCSVNNTRDFFQKKKQFSFYQKKILTYAFNNWTNIIQKIKENLSDKWIFDSISNLEKAILTVAIAEGWSDTTPKKVVIVEAVKLTKKFASIESYTYINKILERILLFI